MWETRDIAKVCCELDKNLWEIKLDKRYEMQDLLTEETELVEGLHI